MTARPNIIAPLMPQLGVVDVATSLAFYRDVLGFECTVLHDNAGEPLVIEVRCGQARLQLASHDGTAANEEQRRARAATILFFQVDNVQAFHATLLAGGGDPSELEDVDYWMKMRVFDVRDPDGHALWFGQAI